MKRILFILMILSLTGMMFSCQEDNNSDQEPFFSIDAEELNKAKQPFAKEGVEIRSISVNSNQKVTAVSDQPEWCIITVSAIGSNSTFTIFCKPNEKAGTRTSAITVSCKNYPEIIFDVTQFGQAPAIFVSEAENGVLIQDEQVEFTLEITSNIPVRFELPSWITEQGGNPAEDNKTYAFKADTMKTGQRDSVITVKPLDDNIEMEAIKVPITQKIRSMHLYLLIGQSNMAGRGTVEQEDQVENPRILCLNKDNEWVVAKDPIHFDYPQAGVGPGLSFARKMLEYGNEDVKIGLIPCAVGGSNIGVWKAGTLFDYSGKQSYPYDEAVARTKIAMENGVLKGILWHQGESDAPYPARVDVYKGRLINLVSDLRIEFGNPEIPFVAGELAGVWTQGFDLNIVLHEAKADIEHYDVVLARGFTLNSDGIHLNSASQRIFGQGYAEIMRDVQQDVISPVPLFKITMAAALDMGVGDQQLLSATVRPSNTTNKTITWSSNNTNIVSVDATGRLTAKTLGTAIITATIDTISAQCTVNAVNMQTSIHKLYLDGYEGTSVKLVFSNDAEEDVMIRNRVADIPDSYINQILKSISLDGGTPVLIGRTVNGDIRLKLNGSALTFKDPVSGSIPVGSIAEFQLIQTDASTLAGSYKQEADLDLLDLVWSPIGQDNAVFTGSFTGTGYKINNLNVNRGANNTGGLFGRISGATITGVHVASGSVSGKQYIGGVVGRSTASTLSACMNEATVTGTSSVIGGICGNMENGGTITGCVNKGTIGSTESVGGIVGATTGSTGTAVIKGCYNTGRVEMNSGNVGRIGGIIGDIGNNVSSPCLVEILACRNDGNISGNNLIGGIVGDNRTGAATPHTVTACYNTGEVNTSSNGSGICGRAYKLTITACYHTGTMIGSTKRYILAVLQSGGSCSYANCWYLEAAGVSVAPSDVTGTASAFTDSQWPSASDNGWAVGNGTNGYWKSLGSYGGSYPTLYWE